MFMSTQNPFVDIVTSVMLLRGGALDRWVGHECEALIIRISALWSTPSSLPTSEVTMRRAMKEEVSPYQTWPWIWNPNPQSCEKSIATNSTLVYFNRLSRQRHHVFWLSEFPNTKRRQCIWVQVPPNWVRYFLFFFFLSLWEEGWLS